MAFVSRGDRNCILDKPDESQVGPGEYLPLDFTRVQTESKVPFNSNTYRTHKLKKDDSLGPGSYFRKEKNLSYLKHVETNHSFNYEKSLINSLDGTLNISNDFSLLKEIKKKPAFGSATKRFDNQNTSITDTLGPGLYYRDDSFITSLKKNNLNFKITRRKNITSKNTISSSRISTIPSKLHSFGYNLENGYISVNNDPLKGFKHSGTKQDSVGPGSYDVVNPKAWVKNSLDWSRRFNTNNSEAFHPFSSLGNSLIVKENLQDTRTLEVGNKNSKDGKIFKPNKNDIFKYFFKKRTKEGKYDMDLLEDKIYQESPGPGYYHQEKKKGLFKKEKFQFFGSSSERFNDVSPNQIYPIVGPASYFTDKQLKNLSGEHDKKKIIDKTIENEREKLPISIGPGPGYYNIPRKIGKLYVSSISDFGSRLERFPSQEKEKKIIIPDVSNEKSSKAREIQKNFLNKLKIKLSNESTTKPEIKRIFDQKITSVPPVGTYDPDILYTMSYNVKKKVAQSDNANSPFASSINNRFDYNSDMNNRKVGPGYYHKEKKRINLQSKAAFNIKDRKFPLEKVIEHPSPADYDPLNIYEWNKRTYNILFK